MASHPVYTPITFTPNLQNLVGQTPVVPTEDIASDSGFNLGKIFGNALPFAAKTLTTSAMAAMEALDVGRQYVAKPLLGLGVYINDPAAFKEAHGTPFSINNLREGWDAAPMGGGIRGSILKFTLEMAFDPVNYIGMGLFKTSAIRGTQALLPIALSKGPKAVAMTYTARMKLATQIEKVPGYSQLFNRALKGQEVSPSAILNFRKGAREMGIDKNWINAQANVLQHADPTTLKGMRGSLLSGAIPKNRIGEFMGQVDLLGEGIWASGLSIPAWGISKIPYKSGMATTFINAAGKTVPVKQLTGLMGFVGPRSWKTMDNHAAAGNLGSWGLGLTHASAQRSVKRTSHSIMSVLNDAGQRGKSVTEIASDVFYRDGTLLDDSFEAAAGRAGVNKSRLNDDMEVFRQAIVGLRKTDGSDKEFLRIFTNLGTNEDAFLTRLQDLIRPVRFAEMNVIPDPALLDGVKFAAYDWVGKAVDHVFRPLVTTMNGLAFTLLNAGDNIGRAGGVRFLGAQGDDLPFMMRHGLPTEIGEAANGTVASILRDSVENSATATQKAVNAVLHRKLNPTAIENPVLGEVAQLGAKDFTSSFGATTTNLAESIPVATFLNRAVRNLDASAQSQIVMEHASRAFYKSVNDASAAGNLIPLKTWFDDLEASAINPSIKDFLRQRAARFMDDPKATRKFIDKDMTLDKLVLDDIMGSMTDIPENLRLTIQWAVETNLRKGINVYDSVVAGLAKAQTNIPFYAEDALRFKVRNLGASRQRFGQMMDDVLMPQGTKNMIKELTALKEAAKTSDGVRSVMKVVGGQPVKQARAQLKSRIATLTETIKTSYKPYALRQKQAMAQDQAVFDGIIATLDAGKMMSKEDLKFWDEFRQLHPMASESTDMLVYTQLSQAAKANDQLSTQMVLAYENVNLNLHDLIADRMWSMTTDLQIYKEAINNGNELGAKTILARLASRQGDFKPALKAFQETGNLPTMMEMMSKFRGASEMTFYRAQGAKLEMADTMVDLMAKGKYGPMDLLSMGKKLEIEVFQIGNVGKAREHWAEVAASRYGMLGEALPHVQPQRLQIIQKVQDLQKVVDDRLALAGKPTNAPAYDRVIKSLEQRDVGDINPITGKVTEFVIEENNRPLELAVMKHLQETDQTAGDLVAAMRKTNKVPDALMVTPADPAALANTDEGFAALVRELEQVKLLEANPPIRAAKEMFRSIQDHYQDLGKSFYTAVQKVMPNNYRKFLSNRLQETTKKTLKMAFNQDLDDQSLIQLQQLVGRLADIGDSADRGVKAKLSSLYRDAVQGPGMDAMHRYMVDYNLQTNFENVISEILPFASFQLHLPQYLASTFVHRPGLLAMMNHFTQTAQEEGMFRGGLLFGSVPGGGAMMFAPQLRFSWLPLMAGQNFVDADDSFQNQIFDVMDLFGFMPGPHVQAATDMWTEFADQAGIPGVKGGDKQMKYGIIPQLRWVQDITSMMSINDSRGVNLPFFGATTDVRDREVQKNLAARVTKRIAEARFERGRDLYPEEVEDIRDFVYENELESARKSVSLTDLVTSQVPGLKVYSDTAIQVHERVAEWINENTELDGVTKSNTVPKYKELNSLQRAQLLQAIPEYEDILAIPPFAESGSEKIERKARTSYFKTIDTLKAGLTQTQRAIDASLESGEINIIEWRKARSASRTQYGASLTGLQSVPEFKPIADKERELPTDPADAAWTKYNAIVPMDFNGNGFLDTEDFDQFYDFKDQFMAQLDPSIRNYIDERRKIDMTPLEQQFETAQDQYGVYRDIPKWQGFTEEQSKRAEAVLADVNTLARLTPGSDTRVSLIMTMPGLTSEERLLALQALRAPLNPARLYYWNDKPLLTQFYPDFAPNPESFIPSTGAAF